MPTKSPPPFLYTQALLRNVSSKSSLLLDLGCGTGLSGKLISDESNSFLAGYDFLIEMLALAKLKEIYNKLYYNDIYNSKQSFNNKCYVVVSVLVISPTHAKSETVDLTLSNLRN